MLQNLSVWIYYLSGTFWENVEDEDVYQKTSDGYSVLWIVQQDIKNDVDTQGNKHGYHQESRDKNKRNKTYSTSFLITAFSVITT